MQVNTDVEVTHISRNEAKFQWENPDIAYDCIQVKLINMTEPDFEYKVAEDTLGHDMTSYSCDSLTECHRCRFEVHFMRFGSSVSMKYQNFRAVHSVTQLQKLYGKAKAFTNTIPSLMRTCPAFLRCKPAMYYEYIKKYQNRIMRPYRKDNHGDHGNPANLQLPGLFFSTDHSPSDQSMFGDMRLLVKPTVLFDENTNLYFSDFYCNGRPHYVTLILTVKDSKADMFCQQHLLKLDPYQNPFMTLVKQDDLDLPPEVKVIYAFKELWVELFYTENVHIRKYSSDFVFRSVDTFGLGRSRYTGIEKKLNCRKCNISE